MLLETVLYQAEKAKHIIRDLLTVK